MDHKDVAAMAKAAIAKHAPAQELPAPARAANSPTDMVLLAADAIQTRFPLMGRKMALDIAATVVWILPGQIKPQHQGTTIVVCLNEDNNFVAIETDNKSLESSAIVYVVTDDNGNTEDRNLYRAYGTEGSDLGFDVHIERGHFATPAYGTKTFEEFEKGRNIEVIKKEQKQE